MKFFSRLIAGSTAVNTLCSEVNSGVIHSAALEKQFPLQFSSFRDEPREIFPENNDFPRKLLLFPRSCLGLCCVAAPAVFPPTTLWDMSSRILGIFSLVRKDP
ncbi:hypothetical protein CEXT_799691 [Caerostris extrusa]|uniref:Secreted protein n=1 Tax=Caerostris extrusa TaxID=172846 RepID=A0AAV4WE10_CAEEX|nr:hypothetical protein CEXT_799691 [Caerostris extrusa]